MCQNNKSGCLHFRRLFNGPFINRIVHANLINNVKYLLHTTLLYIEYIIFIDGETRKITYLYKKNSNTQYTHVWLSAGLTPIDLFAK